MINTLRTLMSRQAMRCRAHRRAGIGRYTPGPLQEHLDAAADWLAHAQDAGVAGGVPAYYDLDRKRWAAAYPETTGYIIPTLYTYADYARRADFFERATRMAHWECDVQMDNGAVRAGLMDARRIVPTVFNTGQVLFGWAAAYKITGTDRFAEAMKRAADWLLAVQDDDGAWRTHGSPFATHPLNTYNTRSALGLVEAAHVLDERRYARAARANLAWALTQMRDNGWLDNNDLEDNRRPLTHTLGYALHGLVEAGLKLGEARFVDAAKPGLAALLDAQRADGGLPGRLDRRWRGRAAWSCLTGEVQIADAWLQLADIDDSRAWREGAESAIMFVASTQDMNTSDETLRGAIAGSYPIFGGYMTDRYPNWAAKFFMDAVMRLRRTGQANA